METLTGHGTLFTLFYSALYCVVLNGRSNKHCTEYTAYAAGLKLHTQIMKLYTNYNKQLYTTLHERETSMVKKNFFNKHLFNKKL